MSEEINHYTVATKIRQYKKKNYRSPKYLNVSMNEHLALQEHKEYTPAHEKANMDDGDSYMGLKLRVHFGKMDWSVE